MAPEAAVRGGRKPRENQFLFNVGVQGRKTGLTLPDAVRDENGLENVENLFSSPTKSVTRGSRANGQSTNGDATISSDDMELGESTVPEPTDILNKRQSMRLPPPRSKSPIKTFLQSPARRNPSLGPASSPLRGSIVVAKLASAAAPVRRKLDFSTEDLEANLEDDATIYGSIQKRAGASSSKAASTFTNGVEHPVLKLSAPELEDDDSESGNAALVDGEDSFQLVNNDDDDDDEAIELIEPEEAISEPEPEPQLAKKARSRLKGKGKEKAREITPEPEPEVEEELESEVQDQAEAEPVKKATNGRGKTRKGHPVDDETERQPAKKTRRSLEVVEPTSKPASNGKVAKRKPAKAASKTKKAAAKPSKLAPISEIESPDIQRGPPLPRNNRGLFILRRETPFEGTGFRQSRYGRNSVKPVAYWKNERIEYSDDEAEDGNTKFLVSRIKEVVRKDEVEDTRPKRANQRPGKKGKKGAGLAEDEEDDEPEPWESNPGRIYNEVRQWDPYDESGVEVAEEEQEVAWSSAAIVTKDVAGATFKFAKCVSMSFFGAGIMDIPVGGIKKPKNSRKMQMVFFVSTGKVQVTINGGDPFRITRGGMWQVPRANFYSICNDGTKPVRIFFSQGCQLEEARVEGEE